MSAFGGKADIAATLLTRDDRKVRQRYWNLIALLRARTLAKILRGLSAFRARMKVQKLLRGACPARGSRPRRLEVLMRERSKRIGELNGKLEQARAQNRRLDEENERLVEMVRLAPSL